MATHTGSVKRKFEECEPESDDSITSEDKEVWHREPARTDNNDQHLQHQRFHSDEAMEVDPPQGLMSQAMQEEMILGEMYLAAKYGDVSTLKCIFLRIGSLATMKRMGDLMHEPGSPLLIAVSNGHVHFVKLLLDKFDIRAKESVPEALKKALAVATANGHKDIEQLLQDRGANVNAM